MSDEPRAPDEGAEAADESVEQAAPADESKADPETSDAEGETAAEDSKADDEPKAEEPEADDEPKPDDEPKADDEPEAAAKESKAATGEVLIQAEKLCKYYGRFTAVEDVSFEVRRGQVVAFLGPNGAGKSTTMKMLTGVLAPDRGEARIAGFSVIHNRIEVAHKLGYLPETGPLYLEMTPRELLNFFGSARGLGGDELSRRVDTMIDRLDLHTVVNKPISKLSKGYRQRVGLAQSLLHQPDVLIMDEPTSGLDPNQIRDVRRIIRELAEDKAILLSTHILQEVEAIADRVVFINKGRIVFQGSVEDLREQGAGNLDDAFASHTGAR